MPIFKEKIDVMGFVNPETKEEQEFNKPYLIIMKDPYDDSSESDDSYVEYPGTVAMRGRREVFDYLCQRLGSFDLLGSFIMSGHIPLGKEVTVYTFLRLCIEKYFSLSNNDIRAEDLENIVYQTSKVNPESFDIDAFYRREINTPN